MKIYKIKYSKIKNNDDYAVIKNNFNKAGVIIVENVLKKEECQKFKYSLEKDFKKFSAFYFKSNKIKKHSGSSGAKVVTNLHNKNINYLKLIDNKKILKISEILLQQGSYKESDPIICQSLTARSPLPNSNEQQLHNDSRIVGSKYPIVVQAMWTLDEFTKNNGATNFLLGSQKFLSFPKNNTIYKKLKIAEAKPGSVILFNGSVWHGGSRPKISFKSRWGVICRYSRWFLKPSYNFCENTPNKIFKKMTVKQKDLLGFRYDPPKDEFTSNSSIQKKFIKPKYYKLPN